MTTYRFKKTTAAERAEEERLAHQAAYKELADEEFASRLKVFNPADGLLRTRRSFGKSQAEMAEIADISRRAYQTYEAGQKTIPAPVLCRIAAYFALDLHELVTGHRSPIDAQTRAAEQHEAILVFRLLVKQYVGKGMAADEMAGIAAQLLKWKRQGEAIDAELIEGATRMVTGDKYLPPTAFELFQNEEGE